MTSPCNGKSFLRWTKLNSDPSIFFRKGTALTLLKERYSEETVDAPPNAPGGYNGAELIIATSTATATASKRVEQ